MHKLHISFLLLELKLCHSTVDCLHVTRCRVQRANLCVCVVEKRGIHTDAACTQGVEAHDTQVIRVGAAALDRTKPLLVVPSMQSAQSSHFVFVLVLTPSTHTHVEAEGGNENSALRTGQQTAPIPENGFSKLGRAQRIDAFQWDLRCNESKKRHLRCLFNKKGRGGGGRGTRDPNVAAKNAGIPIDVEFDEGEARFLFRVGGEEFLQKYTAHQVWRTLQHDGCWNCWTLLLLFLHRHRHLF